MSRDSQLKVSGEDPEQVMYAVKAIENLMALAARGEPIQEQNVRYVLQLVRTGQEEQVQHLAADVLCITAKGKPIKAKTLGQKKYIDAIKKNVVTLGVGPAGHLQLGVPAHHRDPQLMFDQTDIFVKGAEDADGVLQALQVDA